MYRQQRESWCAPAALQNALAMLGIRESQRRLAKLMGEVGDGCDESDVLRAIEASGCEPRVFEAYDRKAASRWLTAMCGLVPILLCVDSFKHWVCVAGGVHERLFVWDPHIGPKGDACGRTGPLGGVRSARPKRIVKRWGASRAAQVEDGGAPYYAIAVVRARL